MILISNLILSIEDGSTVASTSIFGTVSEPKQTYFNIGSGNVFKLKWGTPALNNDTIDYYVLVIKQYDDELGIYYDIFSKNIGLVNEFYVDSYLLPLVPRQYMLSIYVSAHSKYGSTITSNVINPYISKGSGMYVKVKEANVGGDVITYERPIMKRAIAFTKAIRASQVELIDVSGKVLLDNAGKVLFARGTAHIALADSIDRVLRDKTGRVLFARSEDDLLADAEGELLIDAEGRSLLTETPKVFESDDGWSVVQNIYTKVTEDDWLDNNIIDEVLVDLYGSIITDEHNKPVYVY